MKNTEQYKNEKQENFIKIPAISPKRQKNVGCKERGMKLLFKRTGSLYRKFNESR
jgi:hypothetical protein